MAKALKPLYEEDSCEGFFSVLFRFPSKTAVRGFLADLKKKGHQVEGHSTTKDPKGPGVLLAVRIRS